MLTRVITVPSDAVRADADLRQAFARIKQELALPAGFPPEAEAEAKAAADGIRLPDRDETSLPFFTIDPVGSMDLDQAMFLEREGDGYRVRYAIADVPSFVTPGGALDEETRRRGETIYLPDDRIPLHPAVLSEDAASLLDGTVRPAFVWDIRLDTAGAVTGAEVYRAAVKSVARLDYATVQQQIDAGTAPDGITLLKEIGELRIAQEQARGGASLPMPEQEVTRTESGGYQLELRPPVPSEDWNAQISLLTGMCAADMMLRAEVGILRTMPPPDQGSIARFRRQAVALGVPWSTDQKYGDFIRELDRTNPKHLALIYAATSLFRGAGYTAFDGSLPGQTEQSAVAAPYAHVTAPLRRLVDRFALIVCEAVSNGGQVPDWAREALPRLPDIMSRADQLAAKAERASTDAVEAAVLSPRVGDTFDAYVVDLAGKKGNGDSDSADEVVVQLVEHAVTAKATGQAELGTQIKVRLTAADVLAGTLSFEVV